MDRMENGKPSIMEEMVVDPLTVQHSAHQDVRGEGSPQQTRYPSPVIQPSLQESCDDMGSKSSDNVPSTQELRVTRNNSRSLDPDTHMARTKSRSLDPEVSLTRKNTRFSDHEDLLTRKESRSLDPEASMTLKKVNSSGATQQISKQGLSRTSSSVTIDLQGLSEDRSRSPSVDPIYVESIVRERSNPSSSVSSRVPTLQGEMSRTLSSSSFVGFQTSDIDASAPQCRAFANDQRLTEVEGRNQSPVNVNDQTILEHRSSSAYLVTRSSQTRVYGMSRSSTPDISNETPSDESSRGSTPVFEAYDCGTKQCPSPMCVSTQTSVNKSVYGRVCASTQTWSHGWSNMLSKQVPPTEPEETNDDPPVIPSLKTHREAKSRGLQLDCELCCTSRVKRQQKSLLGIKRNVRKNTLQVASSTPVSVKKRRVNTSRISKRVVKKRKTKRLTMSPPATKLTIKLRVRKCPQHTAAPGDPQAQHTRRSKRLPTINNPIKSKIITKSRNVHTKSLSSGNTSTDEAPTGASRTPKTDDTTPSVPSASQPSQTERFGTPSQVISEDEDTEDRTVREKLESESCLINTVNSVPHDTKAKASQPLAPTAHVNTPKRKQTAEVTAASKKHSEDERKVVCSRNTGKKHHRPDDHTASNPHNTTEVFEAVENGDLERVQELIQLTGPTARDQQTGCTLLHAAADSNQPEVLSFLLKLISPSIVNKEGQTPAHLAALKGHTQVLKILLADEDLNLKKRDNCNRTFKDLLSAPLFLAVLSGSVGEIESLLQLGADPDHHSGELVRGALSRELCVTTPRHLARTLDREYMLRWFHTDAMRGRDTKMEAEESATCINNLAATLRLRVRPGRVKTSGPDVYRMDTDPRGYVCILSYSSFQERPDLVLEGSHSDVKNLSNAFGKMGYTGHSHCSLTAQETKQVLTSVRDMELLDRVGCAVFIISSHGIGNEKFLTNDMKRLTTEWVCDFFKDSECPRLKNKPKLFIFDLCRGHYKEQLLRQASAVKSSRVKEPLQDMMCWYSNSGGFLPYTFTKDGTPFSRALCRTLVKHAHNKELSELYREFLKEYVKTSPSAAPQLRNLGFTKKFFFNPVTTA